MPSDKNITDAEYIAAAISIHCGQGQEGIEIPYAARVLRVEKDDEFDGVLVQAWVRVHNDEVFQPTAAKRAAALKPQTAEEKNQVEDRPENEQW